MILEVCTEGVAMSLAAARAGASRIELCAALSEGGITPSAGTLKQVVEQINIPVHVMIRPRRGDFMYSEEEFETMLVDVRIAKSFGASGIVFGILEQDGVVDVKRCRQLASEAKGLKLVFHRAFDMTADPYKSLEHLQEIGVDILLTSGHRQTALEGMETIRELVLRNRSGMQIMAGSGINASNAARIASVGVDALHFTSKKELDSKMHYRNSDLESMGVQNLGEYSVEAFDLEKFNAIRNALPLY